LSLSWVSRSAAVSAAAAPNTDKGKWHSKAVVVEKTDGNRREIEQLHALAIAQFTAALPTKVVRRLQS
jgi:hypothetical protein